MKKLEGFTLIEVIIVIIIIGIFIFGSTASFSTSTADQQLKKDAEMIVNNIQLARELVYSRNIENKTISECAKFEGYRLTFQFSSLNRELICRSLTNPTPTVLPSNNFEYKTSVAATPTPQVRDFKVPDAKNNNSLTWTLKHKGKKRCIDIALGINYSSPEVTNPYSC